MNKKKIVFFHLYNDFSGSPHVLSVVLNGLIEKGYQVDLYTSDTKGFLSDLPEVNYHFFHYKWKKNRVRTSISMLYAQLYMFFAALSYTRNREVLFYINTICPFGAALGGYLSGKKVIYHLHEIYIKSNLLYSIYSIVHKKTSYLTLYVSKYLMNKYSLCNDDECVIYNSLSPSFIASCVPNTGKKKRILMITSLKEYKGVFVFFKLAKKLPQYEFELVVNANLNEINNFFSKHEKSPNLHIYSKQDDVHPFFKRAGLVVNLTQPHLCVESFGLTLLEAMAYGIPTICPPIGGPTELVEESVNGFLIDSNNVEQIVEKIIYIFEIADYERLAKNAITKSQKFSYETMLNKIDKKLQII